MARCPKKDGFELAAINAIMKMLYNEIFYAN
jgi:hypothetical protein